MDARLDFLVGYIGSAAAVAFLAACLEAPRVATFTCETPPGLGREQCRLSQTLPAPTAAAAEPRRQTPAAATAVTPAAWR